MDEEFIPSEELIARHKEIPMLIHPTRFVGEGRTEIYVNHGSGNRARYEDATVILSENEEEERVFQELEKMMEKNKKQIVPPEAITLPSDVTKVTSGGIEIPGEISLEEDDGVQEGLASGSEKGKDSDHGHPGGERGGRKIVTTPVGSPSLENMNKNDPWWTPLIKAFFQAHEEHVLDIWEQAYENYNRRVEDGSIIEPHHFEYRIAVDRVDALMEHFVADFAMEGKTKLWSKIIADEGQIRTAIRMRAAQLLESDECQKRIANILREGV